MLLAQRHKVLISSTATQREGWLIKLNTMKINKSLYYLVFITAVAMASCKNTTDNSTSYENNDSNLNSKNDSAAFENRNAASVTNATSTGGGTANPSGSDSTGNKMVESDTSSR